MLNYKTLLVWCSCRELWNWKCISLEMCLTLHLDDSHTNLCKEKTCVCLWSSCMVHAWVWTCIRDVCMCLWRPKDHIRYWFSYANPPCFWRQSVTWPRAPSFNEAACLVNPKDLFISTAPTMSGFFTWMLGTKLRTSACVASTGLTQLYLQPCFL